LQKYIICGLFIPDGKLFSSNYGILYWRYQVKNYLAFFILAFCFGLAVTGTAQGSLNAIPQSQGQEPNYMNYYYPSYNSFAYWNSPYVPAKCAVQDAKERLYANKYMNPNSVWRQVQESKDRLWMVKNACRTCTQGQGFGLVGPDCFRDGR
jgi:hypothetical protein